MYAHANFFGYVIAQRQFSNSRAYFMAALLFIASVVEFTLRQIYR